MLPRWLRQRLARARRRLVVALAALAYLATAVGLPLPARALQDPSAPFPCQDHGCGCLTAEQCWHACCCFSAAEQRAWASRHHVEPPADARCQTAEGWNSRPLREQEAECCAEGESCAACAAAGSSCCDKGKAVTAVAPSRPPGGWVIGSLNQRCRGIHTLWVLSGTDLPPTPAHFAADARPRGWLRPAAAGVPSRNTSPAIPPPRRAA